MAQRFLSLSLIFPPSLLVVFFLILDLLLSESVLTNLLSNQTDKLALLEFKSLINYQTVGALASWNDSTPLCQWVGVTCGLKHQRVTSLNLFDQMLVGTISPNIGNLSFLHSLNLGTNSFYGEIPLEVGRLIRLRDLILTNNFLQGQIPVNLSQCTNLINLALDNNRLEGPIPFQLGSLSRLVTFSLYHNNLTGKIPTSIGNLSALQVFIIANNNLEGEIPDAISQMTSLKDFQVGVNKFSGTLLVEVGTLKELLILDVSYNKLSGEIPSALGRCLALVQLYMQQNLFHGIIPSISQLTGLQYLDLSSNKFSGQIPQYMVNLSFLLNLNLSNNNLEGEVPTQGVFSNASAVEIYNNVKLCGGIPKLHLHRCPTQELQKPGKHTTLKLVLVIVIPIFLIGLTLFLLSFYPIRKLKQKSLETYSFGCFFPKISYTDLLKATDGFSTENLIGSGHHGRVYKGMLSPDETTVAVKVLNLHQRGAAKSFVAECQVLRNIRHRNLVKVLTACSSTDYEGNEFKALVYEFMPNGTLESWLHPRYGQSQTRKLNFLQRINIAIDVAFALHYLHNECQMPIVHCDIKPSNILLDNDLTAHVSDFGLARLLNVYVPIEVSTRGDTYSFGILLLEMFTGRRPTDELFKDDLNLHNFAKMALCGRVTETVDQFLSSEVTQGVHDCTGSSSEHTRIECLVSVFQIGVACSYDFPIDRMNMSDVVLELLLVKDKFLGNGVRDNTTQFTSEISEAIV